MTFKIICSIPSYHKYFNLKITIINYHLSLIHTPNLQYKMVPNSNNANIAIYVINLVSALLLDFFLH